MSSTPIRSTIAAAKPREPILALGVHSMNAPNQPDSFPPDPLDAVIAEYLQQIEAGVVPDREALLSGHPALADLLLVFFADCARLDRQAAELRLSNDPDL